MSTDYRIVYELFNRDLAQVGYQWVVKVGISRHGYYSTTLWDVSEFVGDRQLVKIPNESKIPSGENYEMRVRVLDPVNNQYLPVTIDGEYAGQFYTLVGTFQVGS